MTSWTSELVYRISEHFRLMTVFSLALIGTFRLSIPLCAQRLARHIHVPPVPPLLTGVVVTSGATLRYLIPTCLELFALLLNHRYIDGTYRNVHASYALGSLSSW
jgi:hypothetical protein